MKGSHLGERIESVNHHNAIDYDDRSVVRRGVLPDPQRTGLEAEDFEQVLMACDVNGRAIDQNLVIAGRRDYRARRHARANGDGQNRNNRQRV
jgi:hypothetical protein